MFDVFRRMFRRSEPLTPEVREFITELAGSFVWILAVGLRGTPAVPAAFGEESLRIIAAHRIDVSELGDDDSVFPFNFGDQGKQILPFFSSRELALQFARELGMEHDPPVFQPVELRAGFVTAPMNNCFDLLYNPGSDLERRLSRSEKRLLRSLSARG